jgi:O-antigen/teichoic acid export membrane protein
VALRADIFLLGATMAPAIVGAYSVAKTAAEVVNLIPRSVSPLVTASVAKGMGEEELAPIYKAVITISALGVVGCCVLAAPGVHLLLGREYQIAVPLLRILVFGSAMVGICGLFAHHLYGFGNSLIRLESVVFSILVGLPAMFIAALKSMPQGVALACVAGSIVALLYVTIRLKRRLAYGLVALVVPRWGDVVSLWNWFAKMRRAE